MTEHERPVHPVISQEEIARAIRHGRKLRSDAIHDYFAVVRRRLSRAIARVYRRTQTPLGEPRGPLARTRAGG